VTSEQFAAWLRRIRLADDAATLAAIRQELDDQHGDADDTKPLRFMCTTKRVRLLESN
jgi:hypothetical protein